MENHDQRPIRTADEVQDWFDDVCICASFHARWATFAHTRRLPYVSESVIGDSDVTAIAEYDGKEWFTRPQSTEAVLEWLQRRRQIEESDGQEVFVKMTRNFDGNLRGQMVRTFPAMADAFVNLFECGRYPNDGDFAEETRRQRTVLTKQGRRARFLKRLYEREGIVTDG